MCVETLTGVLFRSSDLLGKPFRAACFPFETLSGSLLSLPIYLLFVSFHSDQLLLLLQIPQVADFPDPDEREKVHTVSQRLLPGFVIAVNRSFQSIGHIFFGLCRNKRRLTRLKRFPDDFGRMFEKNCTTTVIDWRVVKIIVQHSTTSV